LPQNRRLADVVAAGNAAVCLAVVEPLASLPLQARGQRGLTAELHAIDLGIGTAIPPNCLTMDAPL
jgi:hypothetical protein